MLTELIESRTYLDLSPDPQAPRSLSQADLRRDIETDKIPESTLITQAQAHPVQPFATSATDNPISTETQRKSGQAVTSGTLEVIQVSLLRALVFREHPNTFSASSPLWYL